MFQPRMLSIVLAMVIPAICFGETPQQENARLKGELAKLQKELASLESEQSRLRYKLKKRTAQAKQLIGKRNVAVASDKAGPDGDGVAKWHWTVDAKVITDSANVTIGTRVATVTRTAKDRLNVYGQFINKSKEPFRFRMTLIIYERTSFPTKNPPVLGKRSFTTPVLKPRQGININETVYVTNIYAKRLVRIVDIKAVAAK